MAEGHAQCCIVETSPLLRTAAACEILVRECAVVIRKWLNNFDLGLTGLRMASIAGGGKLMVGGVELLSSFGSFSRYKHNLTICHITPP